MGESPWTAVWLLSVGKAAYKYEYNAYRKCLALPFLTLQLYYACFCKYVYQASTYNKHTVFLRSSHRFDSM